MLFTLQGRYVNAIETVNESILHSGRSPLTIAYLGIAYFHTGKQQEYLELLNELKNGSSEKEKKTQYALALLYTGIGDDEQAIDWLEQAYLVKEIEFVWLNVEPMFQRLHSQPRFQSLLRKVGFELGVE